MSRFFTTKDDESSSEYSEYSDDEISNKQIAPKATFSDDGMEVKRVVRSHKDKRLDELSGIIEKIKNKKKINDMSGLLTEFEALLKCFEKTKKVIDSDETPTFYTRCLVNLDEYLNTTWADKKIRATFSKTNSKSLGTLKQKTRKYFKDLTNEMAKFKENPVYSSEEEAVEVVEEVKVEPMVGNWEKQEEEESEDESEYTDDESSEDDGSSWETGSSESVDSNDEENVNMASKFLRKAEHKSKVENKKVKQPKLKKKKSVDDDWSEVKHGIGAVEKPKMFEKDEEVTVEKTLDKIDELLSTRAKKSYGDSDKYELIAELREIVKSKNLGVALDVRILLNTIVSIYDQNRNTSLKMEHWNRLVDFANELFNILSETYVEINLQVNECDVNYTDVENYKIRCSIVSILEQLYEEYNRILQAADSYTVDYVKKYKEKSNLIDLTDKLVLYLENEPHNSVSDFCKTYYCWMSINYYDRNESAETVDKFKKYYIYICTNTKDDILLVKTTLLNIYSMCIRDDYYGARKLMLMSHLQASITNYDINIQIMYNRALVQFGLVAFRKGKIKQAHTALMDILSGMRIKELLAQDVVYLKNVEKSQEQELVEKKRLLPFHLHINLDIVEAVYLFTAMILELQYIVSKELNVKRRSISRNFHYILRLYERYILGPPENIREHIVSATRALRDHDWQSCFNFLVNDYMNINVWDQFSNAEKCKEIIKSNVKEQALRIYLLSCKSCYDNISLDFLSEFVDLDYKKTHTIVSKMILNEDINASMDQPERIVIIQQANPTDLHIAVMQLSEKLQSIGELDDRLLEQRYNNVVAANWKMNGSVEICDQIKKICDECTLPPNTDMIIAPPTLYLSRCKSIFPKYVKLSAQNCHFENKGAFTGETSVLMLKDVGIEWVIIGHSERRSIFNETDAEIAKKVFNATKNKLKTILCIGETLEDRESGNTMQILERQLTKVHEVLKLNDWENVVIAYEPVWAIGTGVTATPQIAQETHLNIRKWIADKIDAKLSKNVTILYGGSVNEKNCNDLAKEKDIDGFLVGGASLKEEFSKIAQSFKDKK